MPDPDFSPGRMTQALRRLQEDERGRTFEAIDESAANTRPGQNGTTKIKQINLLAGAIIGGAYKIKEPLGSGGMGEVYLAYHTGLQRDCALKLIPPEQVTEMGWQRFQQEARAVAKLNHINVVQVSDLGIHEGCLPFYAMEYVPGENLAELLDRKGAMPEATALEIFQQVCHGVGSAHRNGIIHRDLKPANIMVADLDKPHPLVKVLDFGLAKLTQTDREKQSLTAVGDIFGSPFYMSPEQCMGKQLDERSDIYSLGCTLFECLTGRPPFETGLSPVIMAQHQNVEAPTLAAVTRGQKHPPDFSPGIETVVSNTLRKDPARRYQNMDGLAADLALVQHGEPVAALPLKHDYQHQRSETSPTSTSTELANAAKTNRENKRLFAWIGAGAAGCAIVAGVAAVILLNQTPKILPPVKSELEDSGKIFEATGDVTKLKISGDAAYPSPEMLKTTDQERPKVKIWSLMATSPSVDNYEAMIERDCVNFDNGIVNYVISGPDYDKLYVYSFEHKSYAETTIPKWLKEMIKPCPFIIDDLKKDGEEVISGIPCTRYIGHGHGRIDSKKRIVLKYWTTDYFRVTPGIAEACATFGQLPPGLGLPIRYNFKFIAADAEDSYEKMAKHMGPKSRIVHNLLELISVKQKYVDPKIFDVPPVGYKKLKSHLDLYATTFMMPK